jgi:hypothetical protein
VGLFVQLEVGLLIIKFYNGLEVYRAAMGIFNLRVLRTAKTNLLNLLLVMLGKYLTIICYLIVLILLFLFGDIETNPGPPQNLTLNVGHINAIGV